MSGKVDKDEARLRAKALSRWEGEGGSFEAAESTDAALDAGELRILGRIGYAALAQWTEFAPAMRESIVSDVRRPLVTGDRSRARERIMAFLNQVHP